MARNVRRQSGQELSRRTISSVRRYLVWDCSSCGVRGLNANTCKQCPQCGNAKDESDKVERSATLVDENYQHSGADVTCQFCGAENKARFSCRQCGASLDPKFKKQVERFSKASVLAVPLREVQMDSRGFLPTATETPWNDGSKPVVLPEPVAVEEAPDEVRVSPEEPEKEVRETPSPLPTEQTPAASSAPWLLGVVLAVLVGVILAMFLYNKYNTIATTTATVTGVSWTYSLPREDYAARTHTYETESNYWRPPSDAFAVTSYSVITRYEPIYDEVWVPDICTRTEDSSYNDTDGTWVSQTDLVTYDCSRYETRQVGSEPIPGTRWHWKQMEWDTTTPLTASGQSYVVEYPPFVPTATLRQAGEPSTTFSLHVTYVDDDGERQTTTRYYPRSVWEETSIGATYDGAIDGFDRLRAIKGLDPNYHELLE